MKTSTRRSCHVLLPVALLIFSVCCCTNTSVRVSHEPSVDFSLYRTWSWLPDLREEESPPSDIERKLSELVQHQIRWELVERGLRYRPKNADLGIGARLEVEREKHVIHRRTAIETLPSFHSSPSFEVQATQREVAIFERGRLVIRMTDLHQNQEVWRGVYEGRFRDAFTPHVKEAVASTLKSFPAVSSNGLHSFALNSESARAD